MIDSNTVYMIDAFRILLPEGTDRVILRLSIQDPPSLGGPDHQQIHLGFADTEHAVKTLQHMIQHLEDESPPSS